MKNKKNSSFVICHSSLIKPFLQELFYAITIALVALTFLELIWPGVVLAYININLVLIIWLFNASVLLIKNND